MQKKQLLRLMSLIIIGCIIGMGTLGADLEVGARGRAGNRADDNLQVLDMGPRGILPDTMHPLRIHVAFSKPMVELSAVGEELDASSYLHISPELKGRYRWYGTSLLQFEVEGDAPALMHYQASVPAGVRALDGSLLAEAVSTSFSLGELRFLSLRAGSPTSYQSDDIPLDAFSSLYLRFNYPVDRDLVAQSLIVRIDGKIVSYFVYAAAKAKTMRIALGAVVPENAEVSVELPKGAVLIPGSNGTQRSQTRVLTSLKPFRYLSAAIAERGALYADNYQKALVLSYSHPLAEQDRLSIGVGAEVYVGFTSGRQIIVPLPDAFATSQLLTLRVPALKDIYNRALAPEESLAVEPRQLYKSIMLASSSRGRRIWPAYAYDAMLPAISRGVEALRYGYRPLVDPTARGTLQAQDIRKLPVIRLAEDDAKDDEDIVRFNLGLPEGLGSYELLCTWGDDKHPVSDSLKWTVTNLGASVYMAEDEGIVRVSDLETGAPIAGVRASYFDAQSAHKKVCSAHKDETTPRIQSYLGQTNADGIMRFKPKNLSHTYHHLLLEKGDDRVVVSVYYPEPYAPESEDPSYVITDRSLYRPGEELAIGGYLWKETSAQKETRRSEGGAFAPYAPRTGKIYIYAEHSERGYYLKGKAPAPRIAIAELELSPQGGFGTTWTIPTDIELGSYRIILDYDDGDSYVARYISIDEQKVDEVLVGLKQPKALVIGQKSVFELSAKTYSQEPLAGALVSYKVYQSDYGYSPRGAEPLLQAEARLDATGHYRIVLDTSTLVPKEHEQYLLVQAEVTGFDGRVYRAEQEVLVAPAAYSAELETSPLPQKEGEAWKLSYSLSTPEGEAYVPASGDRLVIEAWWTSPWGDESLVDRREFSVGEFGESLASEGSYVLERPAAGSLRFVLTASDAMGRICETTHQGFIADVIGTQRKELSLKANYAPQAASNYEIADYDVQIGQNLIWQIEADKTATSLFVLRSNEAGELAHELVPVQDGVAEYRYVPRAEDGRGFRLDFYVEYRATDDLPPAVEHERLAVYVSMEEQRLKLKAKLPEQAAPSEQIELEVEAPAGSELLVALVDKRRLDQTGHRLADPFKTYYPRELDLMPPFASMLRNDLIELAFSYSKDSNARVKSLLWRGSNRFEDYPWNIMLEEEAMPLLGNKIETKALAKTAAPLADMARADMADNTLNEKARGTLMGLESLASLDVRDDFRALAFFKAGIIVGDDGLVRVPITLPDDLTRYELWVVGAKIGGAKGAQFGSLTQELTVREPIEARIFVPEALRLGDTSVAQLSVQNQSGEELLLETELFIDGNLSDMQPLMVGPGAVAQKTFVLEDLALGAHDIAVRIVDTRASSASDGRSGASDGGTDAAGSIARELHAKTEVSDLRLTEQVKTWGVLTAGSAPVVEKVQLGEGAEGLDYALMLLPIEALDSHIAKSELQSEAWLQDALAVYLKAVFAKALNNTSTDNSSAAIGSAALADARACLLSYQAPDGGFYANAQHYESSYHDSVMLLLAMGIAKEVEAVREASDMQALLAAAQLEKLKNYLLQGYDKQGAYTQHMLKLAGILLGDEQLSGLACRESHKDAAATGSDANDALMHKLLLAIGASTTKLSSHSGSQSQSELMQELGNHISFETSHLSFIDAYKQDSDLLLLLYTYALYRQGISDEHAELGDSLEAEAALARLPRIFVSLLANATEDYRPLNMWHFFLRGLIENAAFSGTATGKVLGRAAGTVTAEIPAIEGLGSRTLALDRSLERVDLEFAHRSGSSPLFYELGLSYKREPQAMMPREEGISVYREIRDSAGKIIDLASEPLIAGRVYRMELILSAPRPRGAIKLQVPFPAGSDIELPYYGAIIDKLGVSYTDYLGSYRTASIEFVAPFAGSYYLPPAQVVDLAYPEIFGSSRGAKLDVVSDNGFSTMNHTEAGETHAGESQAGETHAGGQHD